MDKGRKAEGFFLKNVTIPDPRSTENYEFNIVQTIIKRQIEGGETDKRNKNANTYIGVSEDTSTGFHHMYTM